MMSKLAFSMIDSGCGTEISVVEAAAYCGRALLDVAKNANIIEINRGQLRFYHQLMLEYFAAMELSRIGLSNRLERLSPEVDGGQRKNNQWDQVIITLCGVSEFPDEIIIAVEEKDAYLAAMCISSGIQVQPTTIERTVNGLLDVIATRWAWLDFANCREAACKALIDIGRPAVPFLRKFLGGDPRTEINLDTVKEILGFVVGAGAAAGVALGAIYIVANFPPAI